MKKTKYDVSVIMPVYNAAETVEKSIESILNQEYDNKKIQLIMINDGSNDNSLEIIKKYEAENILVIDKENSGVSDTRNIGLDAAEGKYILFLDSDDTISKNTISSIVPFFDEHYDEIDLVSYKIIPILNGKKLKQHYRSKFLKETGIYDLTEKEGWYTSITTMNYCIKNKFKENIKFEGSYHEDQKFSMYVVKDKMKIGYVKDGTYWYIQNPNSITKTKFYAYYLFEPTMKYWEDFFSEFKGKIPPYYQALFINDINWKNKQGILMPHQFEGEEFEKQFNRIKKILERMDDETILYHPAVDFYQKFYWMSLKDKKEDARKVLTSHRCLALVNQDKLIYASGKVDVDLLKFRIVDDKLKMMVCIKSPVFLYEDEIPKVSVSLDSANLNKQEFPVRESSYSYYNCKEKVAKFYISEIELDYQKLSTFKIFIILHGNEIPSEMHFPMGTVFFDKIKRYQYIYKKNIIEYSHITHAFAIKKATTTRKLKIRLKNFLYYFRKDKKRFIIRTLSYFYNPKKPIWLYYDCKGVKKDNGYYQFMYDIKKKDGIKRYFVSNNSKEFTKGLFENVPKRNIVKFNSIRHKFMYLKASKIITAFVEQNNCSPYTKNSYSYYLDVATIPEVVYLQHGILHAHMPWKYSLDRLPIDREVISSYFEKENFTKNYAFTEEHLIDCGMPRYDFLTPDVKKTNTILYAPSWRSYLVGNEASGFKRLDDIFEESEFFIETKKFLESKELADMLEKYNFTLNFKLHPIFKKYEDMYNIENDRIKIGAELPESEYKVFITDFSSYVFDFVYTKSSLIYFVPDYIKFKSGMNLYRELDFDFKNGFGDFSQTCDETLKILEKVLKNGGQPSKDKLDKMNKFFIHNDKKQRERLYKALISKK